MATVVPTMDDFLHWYHKYKTKECTKSYARQMVGLPYTKWYYLCRDFERGADISKYFRR